jgi:hypothetical protein
MDETLNDITQPTPATLAKYGGTPEGWLALLTEQGGVCGVCGQVPNPSKKDGKRRLVVDHEHVRGWKRMPPEERWTYVRGLCCWWCNSAYLGRGITIAKAEGVVRYLRAYADRRAA